MQVLETRQGDEKGLAVVMQVLETCQGDKTVLALVMLSHEEGSHDVAFLDHRDGAYAMLILA